MKAYVFPGQGAQFPGMGKELFEKSNKAQEMFEKANEILGFRISDIMFGDDSEALKQTKVTQPAIFLHSVILAKLLGENFQPNIVAGHSLGEFSALVSSGYLNFENGLQLVATRAFAMQKACDIEPSTMAAILGLENNVVEEICSSINHIVVPANYNCPGQLVISGSKKGIEIACKKLLEAGARRAISLPVSGAFHSPIMEPAQQELSEAINDVKFGTGICPIYQNTTAKSISNPDEIKINLIKQLTSPVKWTQTMQNMISNGLSSVIEVGPGKVLQGLFKKIDRNIATKSAVL
ncbi:MAG: ACP S-malonyltransferase [Bacteroidota bacterium]|nr:ACP S-malonyltransferase [Bacteroidota bacterium]